MKDRTFERGQGCWNCIHSQGAKEFWTERRQRELSKALQIAVDDPRGENHPRVVNIRRMVDMTDTAVARHELIRCTTGITANGTSLGDLTAHNYLCSRWTGRDGSSLARRGKLDKLPEELLFDLDGGQPTDLSPTQDQKDEKC